MAKDKDDFKPPVMLLQGRTVFLACDEFPVEVRTMLQELVKSMGGTLNPTLLTSTYIIYPPPLPTTSPPSWYTAYQTHISTLPADEPRPVLRPFHFLTLSAHLHRVVPVAELPKDTLFKHYLPASSPSERVWRPQKVWVSRNIDRKWKEDESAQEAIDWCTEQVVRHGGVISGTRREADILLVSLHWPQGQQFARDMRKGQRVEERRWLEELVSAQEGDEEEEEEEGEEERKKREMKERKDKLKSTQEKKAARKAKEEEKPKPKPYRTDYTPEDDEKLYRYLAINDPDGNSWKGHKFFKEMESASSRPGLSWIARHSAESWRERVKKNLPRIQTRVNALLNEQGLDTSFRTKAERDAGMKGVVGAEVGGGKRLNGPVAPGPPKGYGKKVIEEDPFTDEERDSKKQPSKHSGIRLKSSKQPNPFVGDDEEDDSAPVEPQAGPSRTGGLRAEDIPAESEDEGAEGEEEQAGDGMEMDGEGEEGYEGQGGDEGEQGGDEDEQGGDEDMEVEEEQHEEEDIDDEELEMEREELDPAIARQQQLRQRGIKRAREDDDETDGEDGHPEVEGETQVVLGNFMSNFGGNLAGFFGLRSASKAGSGAGGSKAEGKAGRVAEESPSKKGKGRNAMQGVAESMDEDDQQQEQDQENTPPDGIAKPIAFPKPKPRKSGEFKPQPIVPAPSSAGRSDKAAVDSAMAKEIKRKLMVLSKEAGVTYDVTLREMMKFRNEKGAVEMDAFRRSMLKGKGRS